MDFANEEEELAQAMRLAFLAGKSGISLEELKAELEEEVDQ